MNTKKHEIVDVGTILQGGSKVLLEVLKLDNPVARLINDAKEAELWQILEMIRSSPHILNRYMDDFLRAVMELPKANWDEQKLDIYQAFKKFNGFEISTLIEMYLETGHDSPVMAQLNYDLYWSHVIEEEVVQNEDFHQARQVLKWAKAGRPYGNSLPGIPAQASKKCLTILGKYIKAKAKSKNND